MMVMAVSMRWVLQWTRGPDYGVARPAVRTGRPLPP
ncbi:predicted protein [Streptomyces albidoflavus]|nr:predicted protein [Streptomyces albidoflavus]